MRSKCLPTVLWTLAISGFVLAISATKLCDFDIWWHLKTGELIWLWHQIPRYDIYSYTAAGSPWVNHEWLFEVIAWLLYSKLGIVALTTLKICLTAGIAYASFRVISLLCSSRSAALWGTFLILWGIADRVMERPHLFSLFFAAFYFLELNRFIYGQKSRLWELPLLQLFWTNLHGGALLGPLIILAFAAGESAQWLFRRFFTSECPQPVNGERRRHLFLIAGLVFAACIANPGGAEIFSFPVAHLNMHWITEYTQEWMRVSDPRIDNIISQIIFRAVLFLILVSYMINRRCARMSHLAVTILSCALIFGGKRFTPDFLILNTPLLFVNFKTAARRLPVGERARTFFSRFSVVCVAVLSALALRYGVPMVWGGLGVNYLGFGSMTQAEPADMVSFLDENDIRGNVFNEMGLGGYLIYRRWPREKVFMDGRTPVYGDDFYRRFVEAFYVPQNFEELDKQYRFDYLAFKGDMAWNLINFHKYLWRNSKWKLVYFNPQQGLIYVRNDAKFKDLISRFSFKIHPLIGVPKK